MKKKRIHDDDAAGMAICTRLPGSRRYTEEERKAAHELYKKQLEASRLAHEKEHPPLDVQLNKLTTLLQQVKEQPGNETAITQMEDVLAKLKQDYDDGYFDRW